MLASFAAGVLFAACGGDDGPGNAPATGGAASTQAGGTGNGTEAGGSGADGAGATGSEVGGSNGAGADSGSGASTGTGGDSGIGGNGFAEGGGAGDVGSGAAGPNSGGSSSSGGTGSVDDSVSALIDSDGGTLELEGVSVEIPSGALASETEIRLTIGVTPGVAPPDGYVAITDAIRVTPHGLPLSVPAIITLPLTAEPGDAPKAWCLADEDDTSWEELADADVDETTFTFETSHFSDMQGFDFIPPPSGGGLWWARTGGGAVNDTVLGMAPFSDGTLSILARAPGTPIFTGTQATVEGDALVNYDIFGNTFVKSFGDFYKRGNDLGGFSDGSTVVGGNFQGSVLFGNAEPNETPFTAAQQDLFVAHYLDTTFLDWVRRIELASLTTTSSITGVAAVDDGTTIVTGYLNQNALFGEGELNELTLLASGTHFTFVARFQDDGDLIWAKRFVATDSDDFNRPLDVAAFSDGSCVVVGVYEGGVTFGTGEGSPITFDNGTDAGYIAKLSVDGSLVWAKRTTLSVPESVAVDGVSLGIAVTGSYYNGAVFGPGEANQTTLAASGGASKTDAFIASYASDGGVEWVHRGSGTENDQGWAVVRFANGDVAAVGSFTSASFIVAAGTAEAQTLTRPIANAEASFVTQFDSTGTKLWARREGTASYTRLDQLTLLPDGNLLAGGNFAGTVTFGQGQLYETEATSAGSNDVVLLKLRP
jgi:hypothetical protein